MGNISLSLKLAVAANQNIKERDYWLAKLSGEPAKTVLPYDFREAPEGRYHMEGMPFRFPITVDETLLKVARGDDVKIHMLLTAGLALLLNKYTGGRDILVGSSIFRQQTQADFINTTLILRIEPDEDKSFKELLSQVRDTLRDAELHQNYPMTMLLEKLGLPHLPNEFPLCDVALVLENLQDPSYIAAFNCNLLFSFRRREAALEGVLHFNRLRYLKPTIQRIVSHFSLVLERSLANADQPLNHISILDEAEREKILKEFNGPVVEFPTGLTFQQVFHDQVARTPDAVAVIGPAATHLYAQTTLETAEMNLTYRELNARANCLARKLREAGVGRDCIVGVRLEKCLEMFIGIVGIIKAGGAYLPLDPSYPENRLVYMLDNADARWLLTRFDLKDDLPHYSGKIFLLDDPGLYHDYVENPEPVNRTDDLAYVIFTSGTTGRPKGVLIQHNSFLNAAFLYRHMFSLERHRDHILQVASFSFDVFAGDLVRSLLNGAPLVLCPLNVLGDFVSLYELMRSHVISYVEITPAVALPLMRYIHENRLPIDNLRVLNVGADVILAEDFKWLLTHFGQRMQIINSYGITEATIDSSFYFSEAERMPPAGNTPIGKPLPNMQFYILDKGDNLQPIGLTGELYIGGSGLARGYLNRPELTGEKFVHLTIPQPGGAPQTLRLYRTGDVARWLPDGNVDFLGRIDHQLKIRGFRIEIGEIENCMLKHPLVKAGIIIARENTSGDKYLCAWYVPSEPGALAPIQLKEFMSAELPDYMVPACFVQMDVIPLTPNGKIDRKALPEPEMNSQTDYVEPQTPVEYKIREIWQKTLNKERIGIYDNFFDSGGHSLKGIQIISALHKEFNVRVPLGEIFRNPTIRGLAQYIGNIDAFCFTPVPAVEKKEYYECSSPQKRLFILHQMDPESIGYNVPNIALLGPASAWDKQRLELTFHTLIQRHESLRTSFHLVNGTPMQKVHEMADFQVFFETIAQGGEKEVNECIRSFIRPFNLTQAPLMRVTFLTGTDEQLILLMDMHHIVTDAVSMSILSREFHMVYNGEQPPAPRIHYKDYSSWLTKPEQVENARKKSRFWIDQFSDEIPVMALPIDFPRPPVQSIEGDYAGFELDAALTAQLNRIAAEQGTTLYSLLLTAFYILLWRLSGQDDIIVGTPVAGRAHSDLDNIIGMFVNTLALRHFPSGDKSFKTFFREVNDATIAAFENQDYPFEELVENVVVSRDASRNPIFDVSFSYVAAGLQQGTSGPSLPIRISKFDLSLAVTERASGLECEFEYCTRLFKPETIRRFITYFIRIVAAAAHYPGIFPQDIDILSPEEREALLLEFNDNGRRQPYATDATLSRLFSRAVELHPSHVASVDVDMRETTYSELDEQSTLLASCLLERGTTPGDVIGLSAHRSTAMLAGILAILKTGSAYTPMNPQAPAARSGFMLSDCGVKILLATREVLEKSGTPTDWEGETLCIESLLSERLTPTPGELEHISAITAAQDASNIAYVIYTSGTTGNPKGVPVSHANLSPLLAWGWDYFAVQPHHRFLQNLSCYFDWSVWEIFLALTSGARLYMIAAETLLDAEAAIDFMQTHSITVFHVTPTQWSFYLNSGREIPSLTHLVIGAEKLPQEIVRRSFSVVRPSCRIFNQYGPTEATIISATLEIPRNGGADLYPELSSIPIGYNAANDRHYILDKFMNLCPMGVTGELYIAGDGLSAGYWNQPQLTREKFIMFNNIRVYKTGDFARRLPDGAIEFLGRGDHQVKIRGFRIELGEIEGKLLDHPDVANGVVLALDDFRGDKFLCAWCVRAGNTAETEAEDNWDASIRSFLTRSLPDYMIPACFIRLDAIPLTPNGKLDRNALPTPSGVFRETASPPSSELEIQIARIWADILSVPENVIGRESCFFKLGGHSLRAAAFTARLKSELDITLPLVQLFRFSTLAQLAAYIRGEDENEKTLSPNSIVLMNKGRKGVNLFFIHDGGGQVEGYVSITRAVDFAVCWGLRYNQSSELGPQNISIRELAENYIRDIQTVQATGPYHFVGWSFGGTLAFEIARQLEASGETVAFLMIIDAPPPHPEWRNRSINYDSQSELNFLKSFFPVQSLIDQLAGETALERIWQIIANVADDDEDILRRFRAAIPPSLAALILHFDQLSPNELVRSVNRFRTFGASRDSYFPPNKINASIHYVQAEDSEVIEPETWATFTRQEFYSLTVPGLHQTVIQFANVPMITHWMKKSLNPHPTSPQNN